MESIILTASVTGVEKSILAGARSAERALNLRPRIDTSGLTRMSGPLGRINQQASEFNKSLEASNARVLAFGASAGAIYAVQRALSAVVRDAIEVEKILTDINSVLGQSSQKLADFSAKIFDAAKLYGTSFKVAAEAALELSRQGLSAEATVKRLGASLLLARLGGMEAKDAVEGLTAAINSFSKEALDDVQVVNKLASVAAAFAVSEKDLTEALKRSASAASDAGVSFDELVALVTSAQQTTARGGAVIGNALKTIFTRIQRSDTLDQLKELGIAVRDVNGELLGAPDILKNLAKTYDTLGQEQKAFVSELVGGVFQINQLKAQLNDLSKDYGFYVRALKEANGATGEAIARNEELNKTTAAMLNKISVSITEISSSIGGDILRPIIGNIDTVFSEALDLISSKGKDSGLSFGKMLVDGIASALSGPGLVLVATAISALTIKLASFAAGAAKSVLDIVSGAEKQRQIQAQIQMILAESGKSYADIIRGATSVEQIEKRILAVVRERLALQASQNSLAANLSPGGPFSTGPKIKAAGLNYAGGKITLGRGPVSNFADPIEAAIKREKAAGIPASQIYIDRDPRVKSPGNPLGILVANKRDEPLGGFQGVNRALAMGIDPKKHGGGFVPNFAAFDTLKRNLGTAGAAETEFFITPEQSKKLRSLFGKLTSSVAKMDRQLSFELGEEIQKYTKEIKLTGESEKKIQGVLAERFNNLVKLEKRSAMLIESNPNEQYYKENPGSPEYVPYQGPISSSRQKSLKRQVEAVQRAMARQADFESAEEAVRSGASFEKLNPAQQTAIRERAQEYALSSPELSGAKLKDIQATPEALRVYKEKIKEYQTKFVDSVAKTVDFDKVLSETFDQRSGFRLGAFGTKKGDLGLLESKLKRKLTPQEMLAFESRQSQMQSDRRGRLTGYGIGASFLVSALAGSGALEGMFGDSQGSRLASGGLQGAATGATFGSFLGLPGIIGGAAIGGVMGGLVSAGKEAEVTLQKTAEAYKNLSAELNSNVQNVQNYANTQQQLNDLIKSGTAKEQDITNLNNQLSALFNSITDQKARNDILNAAGNIDALNAALDSLARKNGERLAQESIGVAVAFANQNKAGTSSFFGAKFGGSVRTEDLEKIGQAVAAASKITDKELNDLRDSFDSLNKGSDIKAVSEALKKLGVDASGIDTDVRGLLVVLRSFIDNKGLNNATEETRKIGQKHLLQLQEYNNQFKSLVTSIIEQGQLAEMQRLADREIQVAGAEQRSRMLGGTQLSIFERDANISRMKLAFSNESQVSGLNRQTIEKIGEFASKNLSEFVNKKQVLGALGQNPTEQLNSLLNLSQNSFKDQASARKELETMLREYRYSIDQLSIEQSKQIELLEQSVKIEREMLKRADLSRTFGGAGNFGQPINTEVLRSGFRAGAAVGISDRALASRRYIAGEDRYAMEKTAMPDRLTAAKGLIEMAQMLPEGVTGFRTAENFETVRAATEEDLRGKNNQALLASIQGFFEGQEKLGGAFGPGGPSAGMGKDYRDRIMTLLSQSNGGRDLSGLQKFVNSSQLGVRSPEALRQLKTIVDGFAQNAKNLPEAATKIAETLFPLGKKDSVAEKSLSELQAIAKSTADMKASIDKQLALFELQQKQINAQGAVKENEGKLATLNQRRGEMELKANQEQGRIRISRQSNLTEQYGESFGLGERAKRAFSDVTGLNPKNKMFDKSLVYAFSEIEAGGTIDEIYNRINKSKTRNELGRNLTPIVSEEENMIKRLIMYFADGRETRQYEKTIEKMSLLDQEINKTKDNFIILSKELSTATEELKKYLDAQNKGNSGGAGGGNGAGATNSTSSGTNSSGVQATGSTNGQSGSAQESNPNEAKPTGYSIIQYGPGSEKFGGVKKTGSEMMAELEATKSQRGGGAYSIASYGPGSKKFDSQGQSALDRASSDLSSSLSYVKTRAGISAYESTRTFDQSRRGELNDKQVEAELKAAERMKEAIEQGGIFAAEKLNEKLTSALEGASEAIKIQTETKLQGAFKVIIEDSKATLEEINKLQKQIEDAIAEIVMLKNKDKVASGENTAPSTTPNASGAKR